VELAGINEELTDLTGLVGSGPYRAGTPQRAALDARIAGLATRQDALTSATVKQSGWAWESTGELFGDWWDRQDTEAKNIWLRSMNVRVEFDRELLHLNLGDIFELTRHMKASGPVTEWQAVLKAMAENDIAGMEISGDDVMLHHRDGRTVSPAELDES
jgi:site-specific DNA recombinase